MTDPGNASGWRGGAATGRLVGRMSAWALASVALTSWPAWNDDVLGVYAVACAGGAGAGIVAGWLSDRVARRAARRPGRWLLIGGLGVPAAVAAALATLVASRWLGRWWYAGTMWGVWVAGYVAGLSRSPRRPRTAA
jgi:hypothetical protein